MQYLRDDGNECIQTTVGLEKHRGWHKRRHASTSITHAACTSVSSLVKKTLIRNSWSQRVFRTAPAAFDDYSDDDDSVVCLEQPVISPKAKVHAPVSSKTTTEAQLKDDMSPKSASQKLVSAPQ